MAAGRFPRAPRLTAAPANGRPARQRPPCQRRGPAQPPPRLQRAETSTSTSTSTSTRLRLAPPPPSAPPEFLARSGAILAPSLKLVARALRLLLARARRLAGDGFRWRPPRLEQAVRSGWAGLG